MSQVSEGIYLGPSVNWYCTRISDCNDNGIFAYGSRNYVVTINIRNEPPVYQHIHVCHKDRITSVVFSRNTDGNNILATGAEDGTVKIWDITSWTAVHEYNGLQKINCIDWQFASSGTVFITDDSGIILMWELQKKSTTTLVHGIRKKPLILLSNRNNNSQLLVGFKDGLIAVLDTLKKGHVLYKLKGHEDDVLSLSWNVSLNSTDSDTKSYQLATTSKDKTLRVWDVQQERCTATFSIPHRGHKDDAKSRMWLVSSWVHSSQKDLICSTYMGELLYVTLTPDGKSEHQVFDVRKNGGHNRCIFNISVFQDVAVTISLDRTIVIWDLKKKKSSYALPTLGGFAYSMSFSSIDVGRLAVGVGDNAIRIWNIMSALSPYNCTSSWQGIKGKVIALAWHPEKENLLAFGTDEGRVGIADLLSNKQPIISSTYHHNSVYSLSWGPCKKLRDEKSQWFVYSCGDGKIFIHDPSKPQSEAIHFKTFLTSSTAKSASNYSEMSWKPDWTAFAVGCEDGVVEVYSSNFTLLACLTAQKKLVQCLRWHPICTTVNSQRSEYHCWLACASNELVIHVYDLKDLLENIEENESVSKDTCVILHSSRQLNVHRLRVTSVSWSPHQEGRLASASYDASVQIWDVITGSPLANYRGHQGRVFCVEWSQLNPDVVFSGSEDFSVQQFCVSKIQHRFPISSKKEKRIRKKKVNSLLDDSAKSGDSTLLAEELEELLLKKKNELKAELLPSVDEDDVSVKKLDTIDKATILNNEEKLEDDRDKSSGDASISVMGHTDVAETSVTNYSKQTHSGTSIESRKKRKTTKSMFPLISALDNRGKSQGLEDCKTLVDNMALNTFAATSENHNLGFFMDRKTFTKMLDIEGTHHQKEGNTDYACQMKLWRGDPGDCLREAAEKGQLNDWLVSVAPLGSRSLWLEMCEKYSRQLVSEGMFQKAATYLTACHKIYEAVNMLKEHGLYREAVSIAKSRFPKSDPVLQQLVVDWAVKLEKEGSYEMAGKCYFSLREYSQSAKVISKRNSPESFRLAAYMAAKCGNADECESYILSCVQSALVRHEWDEAEGLVGEQLNLGIIDRVAAMRLLIQLHRELTTDLEKTKQIQKAKPLRQMFVEKKLNDIQLWQGYLCNDSSFFGVVVKEWNDQMPSLFTASPNLRNSYYQFLSKLRMSVQHAMNAKELEYQLAVELTLYILQPNVQLVEVLNKVYHSELEFFQATCSLIFPLDHVWMRQHTCLDKAFPMLKDSEDNVLKTTEMIISTFSGVSLPSWLDHMLSDQNKEIVANTQTEDCDNVILSLKAFYAIALVENLQAEIERFEIVNHVADGEACSSQNCESLRETLVLLLTLLCCHLLNPIYGEEIFAKQRLASTEESLAAATVAQKKSGTPGDSIDVVELQKQRQELLDRLAEIATQTENVPFPNPIVSANKCVKLVETISQKIICSFLQSKLCYMIQIVSKWTTTNAFQDCIFSWNGIDVMLRLTISH